MGATNLKVLMFPWLAYGHITPQLQLAKKLCDRGFIIYFCSTPINLEFIKKEIPEKYSPSFHPLPLHLPDTPELPPCYHTTNGLPPHLMPKLKIALFRAKTNLSGILKNLSPDLVIYDALLTWIASLTSVQGIPAVKFLFTSASTAAYASHLAINPGVEFPFQAIHLSDFHQSRALKKIESDHPDVQEDGPEDERPNRFCDGIMLLKSSREIEGKYMDYLYDIIRMKMIPLGPMFSVVCNDHQQDGHHELIQWLETKSDLSTVFVSFGSETFLTNEEREEIAFGLELSGKGEHLRRTVKDVKEKMELTGNQELDEAVELLKQLK
ncbi:OLC1v1026281C1 [Oldenlandia corymbosa var. corymbosa]|uniref:OLC1v1026281C1 n=1 Tax=Oldenlandia corymbosa var. corymbosa TaxID=529605 RepID=A0AAV1C8H2_OLDCO|nr:OLC1v1026281C1 [Oldenlandia corymbosa var. corymbosa]